MAGAPAMAGDVMALMTAPPDDPAAVTEVLDRSPAMAGRLLATINSPGYSTIETVRSVEHAVSLLGAREARRLTLGYAMLNFSQSWSVDEELSRQWWKGSLRKACVAARFCREAGGGRRDEAFTLALIQDIGMIGLIACDAGFYERLPEGLNPWRLQELEVEHFGMDHASAGRSLLIRWGVGKALWREVAYHHRRQDHEDAAAAGLELAGCLPHLVGVADDAALRRMQELHAAHLGDGAAPLADLLAEASDQAAQMRGESPDPELSSQEIETRLRRAVAEELLSSTQQTLRLRQALSQTERELAIVSGEALTDPLTGVLNRRGLFRELTRRLAEDRSAGPSICCVVCDLDAFKTINDRYGHAAGDEVLRHMAGLLTEQLRGHVVGRVGGDEFCAALLGVDASAAAQTVARLQEKLRRVEVATAAGHLVEYSASVGSGFAESLDPDRPLDELFSRADADMYLVKQRRLGRRSA